MAVRPNEHEIPGVYELAEKLGVDEVKIKTAQIYDYKFGNPLIPTIDKYNRYHKNSDGTFSLKSKIDGNCWKMWHASVITWDGNIVPCCFDKDAAHEMGKLKDQSFKEVWSGERYHSFRELILDGRENIDICSNCSEGCKVWA